MSNKKKNNRENHKHSVVFVPGWHGQGCNGHDVGNIDRRETEVLHFHSYGHSPAMENFKLTMRTKQKPMKHMCIQD